MTILPLTVSSLAGDGPQSLRRRAARDGYLYLPGLVERPAVLALGRQVLEHCAELGWLDPTWPLTAARPRPGARGPGYQGPGFTELQRRVQVLEAFQALGREPALLGVLDWLLDGPPRQGLGSLCRVLLPDDPLAITPAHQDGYYLRREPRFWIAWLPLSDCALEQGPLALLPGSHRGGLRRHDGDRAGATAGVVVSADTRWAAADLRAGDVLLFHALTVHRSCPNRSRRLRLSADFRYGPVRADALVLR
ncbi:MAG: phytanoyl-CoA dioxygenase family protein [Candidatus Competibacteraceae bacterium]|nr:phytanoyl-CoA dioxygenase family protein [Candidatus Competibacteraceae bacterium]